MIAKAIKSIFRFNGILFPNNDATPKENAPAKQVNQPNGNGGTAPSSASMSANGAGPNPTWSPWAVQSMAFTATSSTQILRFYAIGTGLPPYLMLDGVRLEQIPEPSTLALVFASMLGSIAVYRNTRWKQLRN